MGTLDGPARQAAAQAIAAVGATVTLLEGSGGDYDPATGTVKGHADLSHEVPAVIEEADSQSGERERTSPHGMKKVTVPALKLEEKTDNAPSKSWRVEFGSVTWDVTAVDEEYSGDQVALYVLWVEQ